MDKEKKSKIAVALKYDLGDNAPIVVAKGRGVVAEKILEKAKDENVKVFENEELANQLVKIDIGTEIPEEFYTAVAEILAFIFQLDKEKGESIVK